MSAALRGFGSFTTTSTELETAAATAREAVQRGGTVLVHCHAGMERAPTVACATLLLMGWTLDEAFRRVREAREGAMPTESSSPALRTLAARQGPAQR